MMNMMKNPVPDTIRIYHIVHIDRLASIIKDGFIWSDTVTRERHSAGTTIGMDAIKNRRAHVRLSCYPDLFVGNCVPFYFCPRSVMLYLFYKNNHPDITYYGGQEPILHLVFNLKQAADWALRNNKRWVFTDTNAGSFYFNDYNDMNQLHMIDWNAVQAADWQNCREQKQAEFLVEDKISWNLIESIGVFSRVQLDQANRIIHSSAQLYTEHQPAVRVMKNWYY